MTEDRRAKLSLLQQSTFGTGVQAHHGGTSRTGQRKTTRPIEPTLPLYVVLRSSRARGKWSLSRAPTRTAVKETLRVLSQRHGIKIFEFSNGGDQVHLLLRAESRASFQAFLRAFAGLVARQVTGARKGKPSGRFWDALTFSRVLNWGEEFDLVRGLLAGGDLEALANIHQPPKPSRTSLKRASAR
ncbi:MAG TPA: transposase [Polyangiaceae bacterium]|jgi:REP element-mobilizing transposase RayT|nr:transposase [Polyangiaceae bacterium]